MTRYLEAFLQYVYSLYNIPTAAFGGTTTATVFAIVAYDPEWSQGPRIFPPPSALTDDPSTPFIPYTSSELSPTARRRVAGPRVTTDGGRNIGRGIEGIVNLDWLRGGNGP